MIEYCTKRILTIALVILVVVSSIIFFIEESVTFALRPPRTFDHVNPCMENQSFHYLTSCQPCDRVDMKSDPACKKTGHRVKVVCNAIKLNGDDKSENKMVDSSPSKWVTCDPRTFSDLHAERRSFVIFEAFVGCCGLASYFFVRRQHRRLDQRLVDRIYEELNYTTSQIEQPRANYLERIHVALQDGVAAFQTCACSLENAVVRVTLGKAAVLASITIHGLLMLRFAWRDAYGSTCNVFYRYLMNQTGVSGVCLSWCLQLLGAFLALYCSYFWWGLRLSTHHAYLHGQRLLLRHAYEGYNNDEFNDSIGDLHVPLLMGVCVEGGVAFIDVVLAGGLPALLNLWKRRYIDGRQEDWWMLEFVVFSVRQAVVIYLVHLGLPLTGAYANGVNAVIQTWGLGRASNPFHHLLVYWFSPLLGVWGGILTLKGLQSSSLMWTRHPPSSVGLFDFREASLAATINASTSSSSSDATTPLMHLTSPYNIAGEGLQLAAVCAIPKTFRSKSLTRHRSDRVAWRRSSECRLLPQSIRVSNIDIVSSASSTGSLNTAGLGDSRQSCRRCPIRNQLEGEEEVGIMEFVGRLRRRRSRSLHTSPNVNGSP
ncbi:unnamed protein product [Hydatigera taeniaeformis]|uniref:TLC domain-containing protein n=1 Tax=Hydatigena taeniaeformis TaxID=6205 RepID=A0A158RDQ1_HYDTA|nr:unnamed protein product [Hydatigera taeniaeformis]